MDNSTTDFYQKAAEYEFRGDANSVNLNQQFDGILILAPNVQNHVRSMVGPS